MRSKGFFLANVVGEGEKGGQKDFEENVKERYAKV
jgi:hypothetical protein